MANSIWDATAERHQPLSAANQRRLAQRIRRSADIGGLWLLARRDDLDPGLRAELVATDAVESVQVRDALLTRNDLADTEATALVAGLDQQHMKDLAKDHSTASNVLAAIGDRILTERLGHRAGVGHLVANMHTPPATVAALWDRNAMKDSSSMRVTLNGRFRRRPRDVAALLEHVADPTALLCSISRVNVAAMHTWVDRVGGTAAAAALIDSGAGADIVHAARLAIDGAVSSTLRDYVTLLDSIAEGTNSDGLRAVIAAVRRATLSDELDRELVAGAAAADRDGLEHYIDQLETQACDQRLLADAIASNPEVTPTQIVRVVEHLERRRAIELVAEWTDPHLIAATVDAIDLDAATTAFGAPLCDVADVLGRLDATAWNSIFSRDDLDAATLAAAPASTVATFGLPSRGIELVEAALDGDDAWDLFDTLIDDTDPDVTVGTILDLSNLAAAAA